MIWKRLILICLLSCLPTLAQEPLALIGLALPDEGAYWCAGDQAAVVYALSGWLALHPSPARLGAVRLSVNGLSVEGKSGPLGETITYAIPRSALRDTNAIALTRDGDGEVFIEVEATVYRPVSHETESGVRVIRRYEAQDANGVWNEVRDTVPAGQPVRVTVLVWPDDHADALRVTEPLPAGFEFVDGEAYGMREEVRDGAVVHEMRGAGKPETFRYYIRPESEGRVIALPAEAEVLRRPAVRGHSAAMTLEVRK